MKIRFAGTEAEPSGEPDDDKLTAALAKKIRFAKSSVAIGQHARRASEEAAQETARQQRAAAPKRPILRPGDGFYGLQTLVQPPVV
jgi:hypothetical protein